MLKLKKVIAVMLAVVVSMCCASNAMAGETCLKVGDNIKAESWAFKNTKFCYYTNDGKATALHVGSSLGYSGDFYATSEQDCKDIYFGGQQITLTNQGIPDKDKASQALCVKVI